MPYNQLSPNIFLITLIMLFIALSGVTVYLDLLSNTKQTIFFLQMSDQEAMTFSDFMFILSTTFKIHINHVAISTFVRALFSSSSFFNIVYYYRN